MKQSSMDSPLPSWSRGVSQEVKKPLIRTKLKFDLINMQVVRESDNVGRLPGIWTKRRKKAISILYRYSYLKSEGGREAEFVLEQKNPCPHLFADTPVHTPSARDGPRGESWGSQGQEDCTTLPACLPELLLPFTLQGPPESSGRPSAVPPGPLEVNCSLKRLFFFF